MAVVVVVVVLEEEYTHTHTHTHTHNDKCQHFYRIIFMYDVYMHASGHLDLDTRVRPRTPPGTRPQDRGVKIKE